jgi:glucosamine--fructose-6-phosphate aminotransferase (isomerizing)
MCGIVGYVGPRDVRSLLISGLRLLEYRGYDSAGIALACATELRHTKRAGRLANLVTALAAVPASETPEAAGMAHTRWATHGAPTDTNAHPHFDEAGAIAVIHNGIIENHAELRIALEASGHRFNTEVDTEVIAHLIEESYQGDLREAFEKSVGQLKGQWALLAMHRDEPGRIVAARREAPLAVGLGKGEQFIASDPVAILEYTNQIVFLRDGDLVDVKVDGITFYDAFGAVFSPRPETLTWSPETAQKDGYAHFFRKEIDEQPRTLKAALAGRVSGTTIRIPELDTAGIDVANLRTVDFIACGSAYYATLAAAALAESLLGIPVRCTVASEFRYAPPRLDARTLVIAISQSGETADTLGAVRAARAAGAIVLGIVNAAGSTLTREATVSVMLQAGPEISVAATKSYTSQALVAEVVALDLARLAGRLDPTTEAEWARDLANVPELATAALAASESLPAITAKYHGSTGFTFISRGPGSATALEGALKLKELSYLHAEAYPAGELKHGPISLLGPTHPVVAILLEGPTRTKLESNIMESRARSAPILAIATEGIDTRSLADDVVVIPAARQEIASLIAAIPLQRFAYEMALLEGADIDQPKNLAKSVTVE